MAVLEIAKPGFCTQWQAASAMSVLNPEILTLGKLPPSIPVLHAIAGDETYYWKIRDAWSASGSAAPPPAPAAPLSCTNTTTCCVTRAATGPGCARTT